MALDPSREGSEGPAGRSDYSETHFFCQRTRENYSETRFSAKKAQNPPRAMPRITDPARWAFFLDDHHRERSLRAVRPSFDI